MHTSPLLVAHLYRGLARIGEIGYHGYATQRFGAARIGARA